MEINVVIALAGIFGSGVSAYVGVRVALAEVKGEIKRHQEALEDHSERLLRLERPFFDRRNT